MTFRSLAIEGSQQYYRFLEQNGKGIVSIDVLSVTCVNCSEYFDLVLAQMPYSVEGLQIKLGEDTYEQKDIHAVEFSKATRVLRIRVSDRAKEKLLRTSVEEIKAVSDLKFLVKRVEDWYTQHGEAVCIPSRKPSVTISTASGLQTPSEDQAAAIEGALSNPFCYIWGAPGTGKTKFVLARCVLSYLKAGKRILITAPTNNAVEQTLYSILNVFRDAGIDYRGRLARLGVASAEFAAKYPDVCEDQAQAKMQFALAGEIDSIKTRIKDLEAYSVQLQKYARIEDEWNSFCRSKPTLLAGFAQVDELQVKIQSAQAQLDLLLGKYTALSMQQRQAEQELVQASASVKTCSEKVEQFAHGWRHTMFPKRFEALRLSLTQELDRTEQIEQQLKALQLAISDVTEARQTNETLLLQATEELQAILSELKTISLPFKPVYKQIVAFKQPIQTEPALSALTQYGSILEQGLMRHKPPDGISTEKVTVELAEQRRNLSAAQQRKASLEISFAARMENCQILAATIDTCIGRLSPEDALCDFSHVFLDEAGYCSLVKAAILTAYCCPVTFLGDHMQLPPVCEMNDEKISASPAVAVWAQSALYVEHALAGEDIAADYLNHRQARFCQMKRFDLIHTYRFGQALASVLAKNVYSEYFYGDLESPTEILYIHAAKIPGEKSRTSLSERDAIQEYLSAHRGESIGIVTPYRNQRMLLMESVKLCGYSPESVMTVHGAQGREWDTVLFSVADTGNKWFTSTLIPKSNGTQIINTAVSRAKRKLILVCDCDYWMYQSNELIGKLLQVAQPV